MRTAAFSSSLQISCSHYLIFNLLDLLICFYKAFYRKRRSLLLQPASSLPSDSAAVDISPESAPDTARPTHRHTAAKYIARDFAEQNPTDDHTAFPLPATRFGSENHE